MNLVLISLYRRLMSSSEPCFVVRNPVNISKSIDKAFYDRSFGLIGIKLGFYLFPIKFSTDGRYRDIDVLGFFLKTLLSTYHYFVIIKV